MNKTCQNDLAPPSSRLKGTLQGNVNWPSLEGIDRVVMPQIMWNDINDAPIALKFEMLLYPVISDYM